MNTLRVRMMVALVGRVEAGEDHDGYPEDEDAAREGDVAAHIALCRFFQARNTLPAMATAPRSSQGLPLASTANVLRDGSLP